MVSQDLRDNLYRLYVTPYGIIRISEKNCKKSWFFQVFVYFKWSHGFLTVIFGFLGKFRVGVDFIQKKSKHFRDQNIFREISKKHFSRFFSKTKKFHWRINITILKKSNIFVKKRSIFSKFLYWFFNENFWCPKKSQNFFSEVFQDFFRFRKN